MSEAYTDGQSAQKKRLNTGSSEQEDGYTCLDSALKKTVPNATGQSCDDIDMRFEIEEVEPNESLFEPQPHDAPHAIDELAVLYPVSRARLDDFMQSLSWLVGYCLRHSATIEQMDDLRYKEKQKLYKSYKGIRVALFRESGIAVTKHPMCSLSHMALETPADGTVAPCEAKECIRAPANTTAYQYIRLRERLERMIGDEKMGPLLFDYYQRGVREALSGRDGAESVDFFSGQLFRDLAGDLGSYSAIKFDIFLTLSTDGVGAFNANQYEYWPAVVFLLNLPPSQGFKLKNILPLCAVPGPINPKNLVSFLYPLLDELEEMMGDGIEILSWDGRSRRVRVHLLLGGSDMAAKQKLAFLRGLNGTSPCGICKIYSWWVAKKKHNYSPDVVTETVSSSERGRNPKRATRILYDPRDLSHRKQETFQQYGEIQSLQIDGRYREARERMQDFGFSTPFVTPLVGGTATLVPFRSFFIDTMHLLYQNVAKNIVTYWFSTDERHKDIAFLTNSTSFRFVEEALCYAYRMISSAHRRPRGLRERGRWKATEWKFFVLHTSMAVLHYVLLSEAMDGWWTFVQICELLSRWTLTEADAKRVGELAVAFYEHHRDYYYKLDPDLIHFCKFVMQELLHIEECIRDFGPLPLLAQWAMENFIGDTNRRCKAQNKFAREPQAAGSREDL